ncbi:hypothetical protein H0H92_001226 [Tricholoma furcatifolium]|nr:hypothetical protein H0H92_001226 [Tricholoma furcatifolium]
MIDRVSGFAPPEYQKQVGSITVMRRDGRPLTTLEVETIWMYHDNLIEIFGDDPATARNKMNRPAFDRYCSLYKLECIENGRTEFERMQLPM